MSLEPLPSVLIFRNAKDLDFMEVYDWNLIVLSTSKRADDVKRQRVVAKNNQPKR